MVRVTPICHNTLIEILRIFAIIFLQMLVRYVIENLVIICRFRNRTRVERYPGIEVLHELLGFAVEAGVELARLDLIGDHKFVAVDPVERLLHVDIETPQKHVWRVFW